MGGGGGGGSSRPPISRKQISMREEGGERKKGRKDHLLNSLVAFGLSCISWPVFFTFLFF